ERLCERFSEHGPERIASILRDNSGHAGQAAAALRDLSGSDRGEVDPDDQEHVQTLLTSAAMFSHICKENFRKFDANHNGVLEWTEILLLVNALYENFGLKQPREGFLKSFFEANDANKDGVLSEKEFKIFFEHFLRHAFFDAAAKGSEALPVASRTRTELNEAVRRSKDGIETNSSSGSHGRGVAALRCVAPNGLALRKTADSNDRTEMTVQNGEVVAVLEHWVRTANGWLPVYDSGGQLLLESLQGSTGAERRLRPSPSAAGSPEDVLAAARRAGKPRPAGPDTCDAGISRTASATSTNDASVSVEGILQPGEEDWTERWERLQERFSSLSSGKVLVALRRNKGHAGQAAAELRCLRG
ncbi:unnamed protein product, partial [Polarella glacialis]